MAPKVSRDEPDSLKRWAPALLLLGAAALYLFRLGRVGLYDLDESVYAKVSREMLVLKNWVTPHLDFIPFVEKPPLLYWLNAIALKALGLSEFFARLPTALAAVAGVGFVYGIGRDLWGRHGWRGPREGPSGTRVPGAGGRRLPAAHAGLAACAPAGARAGRRPLPAHHGSLARPRCPRESRVPVVLSRERALPAVPRPPGARELRLPAGLHLPRHDPGLVLPLEHLPARGPAPVLAPDPFGRPCGARIPPHPALAVSPRVGHLHVRLDDAPWVWADASGNPIILMGLPPGPHKVLLELE